MPKRRLPRSFPLAEARALLGGTTRDRDSLILQCGLYMGLRVSEITRLEVPDLDLEAGQCLVREGKGGKDRTVPIPSRLAADLRTWLAGRVVGYVFPSPRGSGRLSSRAVQRMIKRVAVRAGIPDAEKPRKVHPHKLRHTFATQALRSGADIIEVRDLMGHSSVATTQVYLSADGARLKDVSERLALALDGPIAHTESERAA
jgi:integrase